MSTVFGSLEKATGWRVTPNGQIRVNVDATPSEDTDVSALATAYAVRHPDGHSLDILYVAAENGERWVEARRIVSPSDRLKRLDGRLRLMVLPHGRTAFCELRLARPKGERWANLYKASLAELNAQTGVQIAELLREAGAQDVGSREALLGDTDRHRTFLCATFEPSSQEVPILAFLFTRTVPLAGADL